MSYFRVCFSIVCWLALGIHFPSSGRPVEDTMAQRTLACTACHGDQGRAGPDGYYPRLAGKPAQYLYNQLAHFKEGRRHYSLMAGLLDPLNDDYLREIAQYFSALEIPYPAPAPLPPSTSAGALARGRTLALQGDASLRIPACTQCHGKTLTGVMPAVPGLLGLPRDYLNAQLGGWRTGQRKATAPDCMAHIAQGLGTEDISAVATWLSMQTVPKDAKPRRVPVDTSALGPDLQCGSLSITPTPTRARNVPDSAQQSQVVRGAYLARIGNCALCHTARSAPSYAGGRSIDTPFGTVYSSNLTPDRQHGIGSWSAGDFWRAMHHGESKNGRLLNPAFPYTSYTHVTREDTDALFAYLQTTVPVARPNLPHALTWPLGTQAALAVWRALYFTPASENYVMPRGAYLVQGLGHCNACHAGRNKLGGITAEGLTQGGVLPRTGWFAPPLEQAYNPALVGWSEAQWVALLKNGTTGTGHVSGPMAQVVLHSTQYLRDADAWAVARHLNVGTPAGSIANAAAQGKVGTVAPGNGITLYERHCADCHGKAGEGIPRVYPPLAGNPSVMRSNANNLILKLMHGGFAPATAGNPRPYGMPPFMLTLNDADMASVLTHIRTAWGNQADAIREFDINKFRYSLTP